MFCDDDDLNAGKESPLTIQDKGSNPSSDNIFTIYKRGYGNVKLHVIFNRFKQNIFN